ncbi:MAG TPA: hypothetical protein VFQ70_01085 [Candidatus Saccharimonadaceae bacterium]|nr:hypothetical protein [Candidatus Saccharimonadaceae bacterium]
MPTDVLAILTTLGIAAVVYLVDSLYARSWLYVTKTTIIYVTAAILIGVFGEVLVETLYNSLFGLPLWHYQVLPIHHTYTSLFSIVLWSLYGLHLYWVKAAIDKRLPDVGQSQWKLALIFTFESLVLETFANIVWLGVFGKLIFYYTPPDLWHVTTIQNIPCYFAASWAMTATVKRFRRDIVFFPVMAACIITVFMFFP